MFNSKKNRTGGYNNYNTCSITSSTFWGGGLCCVRPKTDYPRCFLLMPSLWVSLLSHCALVLCLQPLQLAGTELDESGMNMNGQ